MVPGPGGRRRAPSSSCGGAGCGRCATWSAHWVETGPWWQSSGVHAVLGSDDATARPTGTDGRRRRCPAGVRTDLAAEREVWRVEAARGLVAAGAGGRGVFDLVLDWADGGWQLARCAD